MLRIAPTLALLVLLGPVFFGLLATIIPAFGYFPALGGDTFSFEPARQLLGEPGLSRSVMVSLWTGLGTTIVSLLVVAGFVAGWSGTRWFRTLQHTISPLLSVPHAAAAFGLAFMIAPSGWLFRLISPEISGLTRPPDLLIINDPAGFAMMAGLVLKEIPFLFLVTLSALPQVKPRRFAHVATSLGYGRMAGFIFCIWPRIYPQIRLAVFAVIAYASSVVDVALILGPTNPAPLAVRLVGWMNDPDLTMRFQASAGAVLQLMLTASSLLIWIGFEKVAGWLLKMVRCQGYRFTRDRPMRIFTLVLVSISIGMVFAGLAVLAMWSISGLWPFPDALPSSFSLKSWSRQIDTSMRPFWITVVIGVASTLIALIVALACLEREQRTGNTGGNRAMFLLYIPLLIPQASFVFGLQLFFLMSGIDASLVGLILVHIVFVLPYLFLSLADPWRAWDKRYGFAAKTMHASDDRIFWSIRVPMLLRSILVAAAVGFAVSIGQYLPTVLIGAGRWPTITTEAVALASGGDRRLIGVYAFLQMVLPFIAFSIAAIIPAILFANRRDMKASS
ncbi:MAG: ABC transporter permease subunit [Rhizobiaceae bacterium]|nr:ABC transporter permease subunit [Rhizobiaceae bacterium]